MEKKRKLVGGIILIAVVLIAGSLWILKKIVPPGEEWISYGNEEIIASIDRQLEGMDIERLVAEKEGYVLEKSIADIQQSVAQGVLTYEELTAVCLYRIKTLDQKHHGYNSVMEVAPDAMEQARMRDRERARINVTSADGEVPPLFGIPVMFKDNINTKGIPTSTGVVAFADFIPDEDAGIVRVLREQGAVILGKNNLSEFANYVSRVMPGGYSGKKGQTVNPFGPLRISPSGSSSGSAVAVTADLTPVSIGTETSGSIVAPAAANSVVGFKPSRSAMPGDGIFPLIREVDTAGPITKNVEDAALVYRAIIKGTTGREVSCDFKGNALQGAVIGLISYDYNDQEMVEKLRCELELSGCRVLDVQIDLGNIEVQNVIQLSFKEDFEEFTAQHGMPITKLEDLISFNKKEQKRRARYGQDLLQAAVTDAAGKTEILSSISEAQKTMDELFCEHGLDAIVFLNSTASMPAAAAGYPELTIPLGADRKGVPQGATFAAGDGQDLKLLELGYAFEQAVKGRILSLLPPLTHGMSSYQGMQGFVTLSR